MPGVILISTEHVPSGKCNPYELLKILASIKPEVIFEEQPNDDKYHSCYADYNSFKSLEVKTILMYKQNNNILNIPVDKSVNVFASIHLHLFFTEIFNQYPELTTLIREHCFLRDKYGFKYLNSKECSVRNENMLILERKIISELASSKSEYINLYNEFQGEVDAREVSMIQNIYEFSSIYKFDKAVFLLGAAHRESIRKKIADHRLLNSTEIVWTFYND